MKDKHSEDYSDNNNNKISKSEFMNKIPKTIIKNGQVINMREDLETKLFNNNNNDAKDNNKGNIIILNKNDNNDKNVQIQIKWIDNTTLLAKMNENDLIIDLKKLIIDNTNNNNNLLTNELEIRNSYPPRVLNNNMTLIEAGLVPNGTVYAKKI